MDDWMEAYFLLGEKGSFGLYLYLCGNMNTFTLALSSAAVRQALQRSDNPCFRTVTDLWEAGYLIMRLDNERPLDFCASPQPATYVKKECKKKTATSCGAASAEHGSMDEASCEPPAHEEPPRRTCSSSSGDG